MSVGTILVDTDPGLGRAFCDVDDALAIHLLVAAGAPIAGLTTCYGNTSLERTHEVGLELGRRWNLPVHRGAARPGDTETEAVRALVAHRGTVLALAPMTNIAAALERGAEWERLVLLGGTRGGGLNLRYIRTTELNFALDEAAAARALCRASVLFPMEACRDVRFGAGDLVGLPPWLRDGCAGWLRIAPFMTGRRAFVPWDVLPAMWLLRPDLFRTERHSVRMAGAFGRRGAVACGTGDVEVVVGVDVEAFRSAWRSHGGER